MLALELACLEELLRDQQLHIAIVNRLIVSLVQMADEGGVDEFLLAGGLRADELDEGRPHLVDIPELLSHQLREVHSFLRWGALRILLSDYLGDIDFCEVAIVCVAADCACVELPVMDTACPVDGQIHSIG